MVSLRKASSDDLDIVLRHRREMFNDMGIANSATSAHPDVLSREFFGKALTDGNYHGWFYQDAERNVVAGGGIILIEYHPSPSNPRLRRPWVVNVYVERNWRRRGLARQLMDVMIDWSRAQGYTNLFLHASNEGRPLYESLGFSPTNEMLLEL